MTAHPLPAADREQHFDEAAQVLVDACARRDAMSPREAAEAAHSPGDPLSVDDLEQLIREQRTHSP